MEKEIKKHNNNIKKIIVGIFLFLAICSFQFLNFKQTEVFASDGNEVYSSYSDLVYSYENFSYDYDGETLPSGYCMRDDYMIYAEQQSVMGLCWAFGSQKVLSTTLMKATGEYYDFSEAWIGTALTYGDKYNLLPNYDIITSTQYTLP